jgi:hypothetical protein
VRRHILDRLTVEYCNIAPAGPESDPYRCHYEGESSHEAGQKAYLWVRARKL